MYESASIREEVSTSSAHPPSTLFLLLVSLVYFHAPQGDHKNFAFPVVHGVGIDIDLRFWPLGINSSFKGMSNTRYITLLHR